MKTMKQILVENTVRKYKRQAARKATPPAVRNHFVNLMLMPNDDIRSLIQEGTNSTYVPPAKGDHRKFAELTRLRKQATRNANWTGARG